jgi:hypothetical protein
VLDRTGLIVFSDERVQSTGARTITNNISGQRLPPETMTTVLESGVPTDAD